MIRKILDNRLRITGWVRMEAGETEKRNEEGGNPLAWKSSLRVVTGHRYLSLTSGSFT